MGWASLRSKPLSFHREKQKTGYLMAENAEGRMLSLSPRQRRLIGAINRAANPFTYLRRAAMARAAWRQAPGAGRLTDGYAMMSAVPGFEAAIALCERQLAIYEDFLAHGEVALQTRGIDPAAYRAEMAKTATDPLKHVPVLYDPAVAAQLLEFGLQPALVAPAARHLGVLPVLSGLRILWSPNVDGALTSAQLVHLDPEGARQTKVFMAVRPVRQENSPFTFLPVGVTRRLVEGGGEVFTSNRIPDKFMAKAVKPDEWVRHVGDPGDALLVDTSNCFHYGSRPAAQPRLLLYYSFHDPFGSSYPLRFPAEKQSKRWNFFTGRPHPFTDWILSRRA